ncbi:hypothetical protein LCGC14_1146950 [marine sediment metagenome]|uniref:Uncharacterized protein n=1 Tax=marine sediment metagenome TaxID=412755 RepID=A0A0F9MJT7_9ZZZZ
MISDKITEKIQQLLVMAEHPNSNENEAAVALEKAQELLLKHNLTRLDIANATGQAPPGIGKLDYTETAGYTWKRQLVSVLANANLCKVIGTPSEKTWHIFGAHDNVSSVLEMYTWITAQLTEMAAREFRTYKNDEGTERGQTWKSGYYQGATDAIRDRLKKPLDTFTYGTGKDLVVQNTTALNTAVRKVYPHLRRAGVSRSRGYDGSIAGKQAGRGMSLVPQRRIGGTLRLSAGR